MANMPAARDLDKTNHGDPTTEKKGSPDISINWRTAWLADQSIHTCKKDGPEEVVSGATNVFFNNHFAVRKGDFLIGSGVPNMILEGSPDVWIGSPEVGIASKENLAAYCKDFCALKKEWASLSPAERKARYQAMI